MQLCNIIMSIESTRKCKGCGRNGNDSFFTNALGKPSKSCIKCLEKGRRNDPKRKDAKKEWNENNREKVSSYWMNNRAKKLLEDNGVAYRKHVAETTKEWRKKNPDKMQEQYNKVKLSHKRHYYNYKRSSEIRGIEFELTIEDATKLFDSECYYCCGKVTTNLMGIDRVDNNKGYQTDNIVPCCAMCNYMKNTLDKNTFVKRVVHIATYNKLYEGELNEDVFSKNKSINYSSYKSNANRKKISFELTKAEYEIIISNNCYICGIKYVLPGLDRVDSTKDYTLDNVKACCSNCNFLKKHYELDILLEKCVEISKNSNKILDDTNEKIELNIVKMKRTKGTLYRNKELEARNNDKRNKLLDPEHVKQRAIELAEKYKKNN